MRNLNPRHAIPFFVAGIALVLLFQGSNDDPIVLVHETPLERKPPNPTKLTAPQPKTHDHVLGSNEILPNSPPPQPLPPFHDDPKREPQTLPIRDSELVPDLPTLIGAHREVLGDMGPKSRERFWSFVEALRSNREESAKILHDDLEFVVNNSLWEQGAGIVFLLGQVAHHSSLPILTSLLELTSDDVPVADVETDNVSSDNMTLIGTLAAEALDQIATRYHNADTVLPVVDALEATLAHPTAARGLKVAAARVLLAHATDPQAREVELAVLMGDDAFLLKTRLIGSKSEVGL